MSNGKELKCKISCSCKVQTCQPLIRENLDIRVKKIWRFYKKWDLIFSHWQLNKPFLIGWINYQYNYYINMLKKREIGSFVVRLSEKWKKNVRLAEEWWDLGGLKFVFFLLIKLPITFLMVLLPLPWLDLNIP